MRENPTWNVAAALLLTVSITMLTDFTHRMLAADPDSIGIFSISTQAIFTVAATTTFTKAGWQWMQRVFSSFRIREQSQPRWRLLLVAVVFAVVCPMWIWLPSKLAQYYNDRGFYARNANPAKALENYERAVALDPRLSRAHFNLAELFESFYQYDKAGAEYQKAIVADRNYVKGYNNLARVLLTCPPNPQVGSYDIRIL